MVELALVLPVLLLLLFSIIDFGRILGTLLALENIARDASRYGVTGHTDREIEDLIWERSSIFGISDLEVQISPPQVERTRGQALTVTLECSVPVICPIISSILPNPFPLRSSCSMMVE